MKQKYFADIDKAGKLLASLIKKRRSKTLITNLIVDKKKITDHEGIKEAFVRYFQKFYESKHAKQEEIQQYLDKFVLAPISHSIIEDLTRI